MFDLCLVPILALHLMCMNVAAAGPLVGAWLEWKGSPDSLAARTAQYLALASWRLLLVGGALGLIYGASQWNAEYQRLWTHTLGYKLKWGIAELVFSGVLLWLNATLSGPYWRTFRMVSGVLAGTNLLYHFPFLFSIASSLRAEGQLDTILTAATFRQWMLHADVLARVVHVVLASFAMTGLVLLGYALRLQKQNIDQSDAARVSRWGGWLALLPSLLQMVVGLWLIAALPPHWQQRLMNDDWVATLCLAISVLASLWLLQDLAAIAMGEFQPALLRRVMTLMLIIVVLMTATLKRIHPPADAKNKALSAQSLHDEALNRLGASIVAP